MEYLFPNERILNPSKGANDAHLTILFFFLSV